MNDSSALRVAVSASGISVWSREIFAAGDATPVRTFLARAFTVAEVERVEVRRSAALGRILYDRAPDPARIWKKLGRVLGSGEAVNDGVREAPRVDADHLYLDGPSTSQIRVSRIDGALSTWRVRRLTDSALSVWHPALLNRRDVVFRLEEELASMFGVAAFRASALSGGASIRFDKAVTSPGRLVRELEKAWPRLVNGLDGPPSTKRLVISVGLVGAAYYGTYVAPAVRPFAVAGVALYALPNVVNAAKDLRHGRVGLPALYSTGLALMLWTGFPFTASVMAFFMQAWPHLTRKKLVATQRRLFAAQRRRPSWARQLGADGAEVEVSLDELRTNDSIIVRRGETIAVDGVVTHGAAVVALVPFGERDVEDKLPGNAVEAGAVVREGALTIRVERAGRETSAHHVDALLPHAWFPALPSSREAERVANRNAKGALLAAGLSFGLTQVLPRSQALIRPDYATALRISAQLATLRGVAEAWHAGVLLRDPAVLDRLSSVDVFVVDDSAGFERKHGELASIRGVGRQLVHDLGARKPQARIVYVSSGSHDAARAAADALGIEVFQGGLTQLAKLSFIRSLDGRVLWIGDGSDPTTKESLAASTVSVSVAPLARAGADAADIQLVRATLAAVPELIELGRAHERRLRLDYSAVYTANLLGATGAIFANLTALHTGLLSNVGAALIYGRHARALEQLARVAEARRASLKRLPPA